MDEGRAGDDTMVGRDIEKFGDTWDSEDGFAAYVLERSPGAPTPRRLRLRHRCGGSRAGEYLGRISLRHELNALPP